MRILKKLPTVFFINFADLFLSTCLGTHNGQAIVERKIFLYSVQTLPPLPRGYPAFARQCEEVQCSAVHRPPKTVIYVFNRHGELPDDTRKRLHYQEATGKAE